MKSIVYFIPIEDYDNKQLVQERLKKLIRDSGLLDGIQRNQTAILKLHFGEEGNTGFVKPEYVRIITEYVKGKKAIPILSDTNTLYRGRRTNASDHTELAYEHGFTEENTGAEVCIPENDQEYEVEIPVGGKFIENAKVARMFIDADFLIDVSHFKGHLMTGFGGALKNIAMGCATRSGKLAQHAEVSPVVDADVCTGCGTCVDACPVDAITLVQEKAVIDNEICIGCATCIAVCPEKAIDVPWQSGSGNMQFKMVEYGKAIISSLPDRIVYINFATKITQECDCLAQDDPRICPDLGIFISDDPVSVDKACYDAVLAKCGKDVFKEVHPKRNAMDQLNYAQQLGMGNLEYDLIDVPVD